MITSDKPEDAFRRAGIWHAELASRSKAAQLVLPHAANTSQVCLKVENGRPVCRGIPEAS